jgi:hypothetical protein
MNLDGLKFTINFKDEQEKNSFNKFLKTLNIVQSNYKISDKQSKNKKNLKYYTYKLKHECDQPDNKDILKNYMKITKNSGKLIKNTTFEQYGFYDVGINNLGPDILNIKETNTLYITLNLKNISYEVKLNENYLSPEEKDFTKKYYTNTELLTKKRFSILSKVLEYIFKNNLDIITKIKEVNFVHYDFSNDKYKFFNETKRKFINSDCTLDIKKYYFDYPVIYNKDYKEYLKIVAFLALKYESEELTVNEYDTFDRIRFITTNQNLKLLKINKQEYFFIPLIGKESSYIKIDNFSNTEISLNNKKLNSKKVFKQLPFQLIKVKVSGWFTRNKKILQSKNEHSKYYYRLSDSIEEINEHINQFLKKYTIYKLQNNSIKEEIIDDEYDYHHRESEYDYMVEDIPSVRIMDDNFDSEITLEKLLEGLNYEKEKLEEIKNLPPIEMINTDIKLNKTIMKKFEIDNTVEKIYFLISLQNLNHILNKYKN